MLFELRTYDFAPGQALAYLEFFSREGLPLITRHLPLAGYWITEVGALNRLRHLWVYKDFADRAARRTRLLADSDWSERFLPKGLARIQRQANQLMTVSAVAHPLEDIVAGADRTHQALPIGAPLLKPGFSNLLGAAVPLQVSLDVTTRFSVIAGDAVGMQIIFSHDAHVGLAPPSGIAFSEILRPAAFSPL